MKRILKTLFWIALIGLLTVPRILVSIRAVKAKPFMTYGRLMSIANICDKYETNYHQYPQTMDELRKFSPEVADPWDKDGWGQMLVLIPYDTNTGHGKVISGGHRELEVHFPLQANTNWNQKLWQSIEKPPFRP